MLNLVLSLHESLFPKYIINEWTLGPDGAIVYGIKERYWGMFYNQITHVKIVQYDDAICSTPSREILTFDTKEDAENEVDRLDMGYPKIERRYWKCGKIIKVIHHESKS